MDKGKQKDVAKKIKSGEAKKVSDVQLAERKEEIVKNINKDIQKFIICFKFPFITIKP